MKYPALKPQQRRNQKLTELQIKHIKSEFTGGKSAWKISQEMKIKYETARRYVDPEFKEKLNNYFNKYNKQKYHDDPEFKKYVSETRKRTQFEQRKRHPELEEYNRQKSIEQRKRNGTYDELCSKK